MRKPILMLAMLSAVLGGCVAYGDGYSRSGTNRDGYYGETYSYPRRDSDRDGIPDAYDRHPYGTNDGYYRRERDRDHDGIPDSRDKDRDGDGVRNKYDSNPDSARSHTDKRDRDSDGVRNKNDSDRDGDGVPNSRDRYPDDPRRN